MTDASQVVRSARLWNELAATLHLQASLMTDIANAIDANNFEDMRSSLIKLVQFVKTRQTTMEKLSPAINQLMTEIFEEDPNGVT